jgi:hypothetical protein
MNVVIIGSGTSAITVAKTFLEYNHQVYLIDAENLEDVVEHKRKTKFLPDLKRSPKFQNKLLTDSLKKFKKKYNIKTKNFYLVSALISGGLSNFWGAGLEIPSLNYLNKYSFGKLILKEQSYIDKEMSINKKRFKFYDFFFKQEIIKKLLKKTHKSIYFSKLSLAIKQSDKKKITINDYHNVDLLSGYNKYVYNAKFQISDLIRNKNFKYIPNTFVKNITKKKGKYKIITDDKKILDLRIDKVIISTGTVGSTILVDKMLNLSENYRLFHTPILKIMYFSLLLPFKIKNNIKFGLALLNININIKNEKFSGSFIQLYNISNYFFGISNKNILFSLIKKFLFIGNIFLPPSYSNTFIDINKKKTLIYSKNNLNKKKIIFELRNRLNSFLNKFNLFEFSPQNLKFLDNGSDAHYTSTLIDKYINGKRIINENCELNNFKNIHVIDGSSIKAGLHYPNYFLMMYSRFISKKIIIHDKKNKNKHKY